MSTILYIDNKYINNLEDLQNLIVKSIKDGETNLYKEIETLFKDQVLQKWLEEGSLDCHKVLSSLILIPNNIDSSKLKEKIGNIFSDEQIEITRRYNDFIELLDSYYSLDKKNYSSLSNDLEFSTENELLCNFKFTFKVLKQESESFNISLFIDDNSVCKNQNLDIRLYRDGDIAQILFNDVLIKLGLKKATLTLKIDNEVIKSIRLNGDYEKIFEIEGKDGNKIIFSMLKIKGGSFYMTQDYHVELTDYYISPLLVTQELWQAVMNFNPSRFVENHHPVEMVSWDDICKRNGFLYKINQMLKNKLPLGWKFALPTEAQWEYAARGGCRSKNTKYSGTDMKALLRYFCWFNENSNGTTHPVGTKKPNELNLFDMCGNVLEWCYDYYGEYPTGNYTNPKGTKSGQYRIERGGSFYHSADDCILSNRRYRESYRSDDLLGFRLCLVKV